ncbi:hypothetical protein GGX14DRAFT_571664 [Mycena pura]|uniref:Uncharacterized protein n=1 Tax=Mycena pura TaxID=153505 RepID=A0AAD6V552_9AGAR|nr:hypothetical protein GGX14DRAFT_571664 [Mycena pura]
MPFHTTQATHAKKRRVEDSDDEENDDPSDRHNPQSSSRSSSRSSSPELREDLPQRELYQVARTQQKKVNDVKRQLRAMERQLADITNQDDSPPKRGRKKRQMVDGGSEEDTEKLKELAHAFVAMRMVWLHDPPTTFTTVVDSQYNPLERFENRASKIQGELAELLEVLPPRFHGETMRSEWVIKTFCDAMQSQRSNTRSRLRGTCGPNIFSGNDTDLATSESRRDKFQAMIGHTTTPEGASRYETFNVPLLHKDYNRSFDINTVFRGEKPQLVFAAIAFGPGSVTNLKRTGKPTPATSKYMARIWGLRNSTPGCIAGSTIFARWAASADVEFTPRGAETGIDWQADLERYIEYLQNGLNKRKASVLNIFREWDELFFPDSETSLAGTCGDDEDHVEKQMRDVMDLLNADEEEVPTGDN